MKKKKGIVYLKLTPEQIESIDPVMKQVTKANDKGAPGMAIAQLVVFRDGNGVALCGFVNNEQAEKIRDAIGTPKEDRFEYINWTEVRNWIGV